MRSVFRILLMFLIVAAGVAALVWAFIPDPVGVDVAQVVRGQLLVTVNEDGKTRIRERYIVSTPLAGRLLRIELDPGDPVEKLKTLLATIEPRDPELLDPRAIALAEARVRAAEATLEKTIPLIEQAREQQAFAERELARARELKKRNAISQSSFDETMLQDRLAAEQLRSARNAQDIARFELEQAQAALLRSRPEEPRDETPNGVSSGPQESSAASNEPTAAENEKIEATADEWTYRIYAPISGRVLRVFQESTAVVTAGMPLLELGDPADLEVVVDVLSQDAVAIKSEDRVLLEHWGGDRPLEGRVRLVEPAAFTKISTLGVEEQRVNVIIDLVERAAQRMALGDGFRVEARIITWETDDALKVPTSALFRHGDEWAVFRINGDRAERTVVMLGNRNGLEAEVESGLQAGDRVVVHPSDSVRDGVRVQQR